MVDVLVQFVGDLLSVFARQAIVGFGLLFLLGALIFFFQRWTQQYLSRAFGWKAVVYSTGWLGTPIHEISHALVGWVWPGIKIKEIVLFEPDPESGVLGYVRYTVPRWSLKDLHKVIGTFIVGIAPLFGGALVLLVALWLLTPSQPVFEQAESLSHVTAASPPDEIASSFLNLVGAIFTAVVRGGWLALIFLYIAVAVGNHLAPSRADLHGGLIGLLSLCGVVLVVDAVFLILAHWWPAVHPGKAAQVLSSATGPFSALLLLALIVNGASLAASFLIYQTSARLRARRARRGG